LLTRGLGIGKGAPSPCPLPDNGEGKQNFCLSFLSLVRERIKERAINYEKNI